jgi:hypothetical protein
VTFLWVVSGLKLELACDWARPRERLSNCHQARFVATGHHQYHPADTSIGLPATRSPSPAVGSWLRANAQVPSARQEITARVWSRVPYLPVYCERSRQPCIEVTSLPGPRLPVSHRTAPAPIRKIHRDGLNARSGLAPCLSPSNTNPSTCQSSVQVDTNSEPCYAISNEEHHRLATYGANIQQTDRPLNAHKVSATVAVQPHRGLPGVTLKPCTSPMPCGRYPVTALCPKRAVHARDRARQQRMRAVVRLYLSPSDASVAMHSKAQRCCCRSAWVKEWPRVQLHRPPAGPETLQQSRRARETVGAFKLLPSRV